MRSPRRLWPGRGAPPWAVALVLTWGCSFHPGGMASVADGGGGGGSDATPADAGPCPEAIHTVLSVDGVTAAGGSNPLTTVLLGDTVALSAAGSCTQSGTITYQWKLTDADGNNAIESTALPDTGSRDLSVYPSLPSDYTVTLTIGDGTTTGKPVSAVGFTARGWQTVADGVDIRDLAIAGDYLFIAGNTGAFVNDINLLGLAPGTVNSLSSGSTIDTDLSAVWFDGNRSVWFGRKPSDNRVWNLDVSGLWSVAEVDFGNTTVTASEVRDIGPGSSGVALASKDGVWEAPDSSTFGDPILSNKDLHTLARTSTEGWAGGDKLYRLSDGMAFDIFNGGDDKIRTLLATGTEIWIGGDGTGMARFDTTTNQVDASWSSKTDGLPSDAIRALAVDGSGDIWAATNAGAARYKQDRQVWVPMEADSGLTSITDLRAAVTLDRSNRRLVVMGSVNAIAILDLTTN